MTTLAPYDRALIDAAVAAGRITRVETPPPKTHRGRGLDPAVAARRVKIAQAVRAGATVRAICDDMELSEPTVRADLFKLGLKAPTGPRRKQGAFDKLAVKKIARAARHVETVKDRRRFRTTAVPFGQPSVLADADATGTIFPTRVFKPADLDHALVDGANNSKIGGDVLVGRLKGARIVTLTLEERATCPTSCGLWRGCYGNAMQHARRIEAGAALEARIKAEVDDLCAAHRLVLVRLHVLGDFYSPAYVGLWLMLLNIYPGLHLFGFTAHRPNTPIGALIAGIREKHPDRFCVRTSGSSGAWGSFTVDFPTEKPMLGDAVVCPEQRDAMSGGGKGMHCGACGLCWAGSTPIVFVEH
jgi:hypothetical protein